MSKRYYSERFVEDVQALLDTPGSVQPTNTSMLQIMEIMTGEGVVQSGTVHMDRLIPHKSNRNGAMLNGYHMTFKRAKILSVSANRSELDGAYCM